MSKGMFRHWIALRKPLRSSDDEPLLSHSRCVGRFCYGLADIRCLADV